MVDKPEILRITDGDTSIDLLTFFNYVRWRPRRLGIKANQSWADSPFAVGSYPVFMQYANIEDLFELVVEGENQDATIEKTQELGRLLEKARQYWTTDWQDQPVWIEARASCETNIRYALIVSYATPNDDDPYISPFEDRAIMENWNLSMIHLPWSENIPGESDCVQVSGIQESEFPFYLDFTQDSPSHVVIPDNAVIQNLPTAGDFTVDGWAYRNSATGARDYQVFKGSGAASFGWYVSMFGGVTAKISFIVNMGTNATYEMAIPLDTWFHYACVWSSATRTAKIFINGVEGAYITSTAGVLPYVGDIGEDLILGNTDTALVDMDGYLGYTHLSGIARWAANFTAPDQCSLPSVDGNTIGLWIYEGYGATATNYEGTSAIDGVITGAEWESGCFTSYGRSATCLEEVFFSLKHNRTQLTHVFVYDASGGVYTANLLTSALPYDLLGSPNVGNSDVIYFGITAGGINQSIFDNLIFDIGTAMVALTTSPVWEYWNGAAWANLVSLNDETDSFSNTGVSSVTWYPQANWATTVVNGITAYWVRFAVPAAPPLIGPPAPPTQQNRQIYTVTWPYIDIAADQVPGDIIAQAYAQIENKHYESIGLPMARYIMSLRSLDRGENFTPYINISDFQAWNGFTITPAVLNVAWVDDNDSPTGRALEYTSAAAIQFNVFSVTIDSSVMKEYYGKFRVYLTSKQTTGTGVSLAKNNLAFYVGTGKTYRYDQVSLIDGSIVEVSYLGEIQIPRQQDLKTTDQLDEFTFLVYCDLVGTYKINFHELILMPADEMIIDSYYFDALVPGCRIGYPLDIDSIQYPKKTIRTWLKAGSNYDYPWYNDSTGELFLQANKDQRLWFFGAREGTDNWRRSITTNSILLNRNARYFSMRGDR